ncbi:MAG: hypothetical protein UV56_C0021G0007 [Candidatus Woesebacteria bacterium GW2011_GWC1_43_10b]|uniref:Uncharacterized protein n=1 Tax=Candidatus Woesebacteria bacterium GW2011_GWC1_43_10b TaxID=1618585 RepID=A0A0G1C4F6_9BACT|nr:MAG: hypothetical protein UV56_C0021G0007 [Candidatus Woesebacteria bacterium GW2011_GWC1_43_10b]
MYCYATIFSMDNVFDKFKERKAKAESLYKSQKNIFNSYLKKEVVFNSDGFHHLQFSSRRERSKEEQILKFNLLPSAIEIIKKSKTLQEYRKDITTVGGKCRDGLFHTRNVEYWGFVAILGDPGRMIKVKTILRRIGDGNVTFWSVMPFSKLKNGQKLHSFGIEDE